MIGESPDEVYPESASKFFLKGLSLPAQFGFTLDAAGHATEMVLHQSGEEQHMPRIADAEGKTAEAALAQRIASNRPSPGTEAALRHQIEGLMSGHPDYGAMAPNLAAGTRQMIAGLHAKVASWGAGDVREIHRRCQERHGRLRGRVPQGSFEMGNRAADPGWKDLKHLFRRGELSL